MSWDSLNFVLVLFAIFCGILGRKKDDDGNATNVAQVPEEPLQPPPVQQEWFGYSDQGMMDMSNSNTIRRLKRNSSSYPDLRQESSWAVPDENWRFYDDSHVYNQRLESNYFHRPRHGQGSQAVYDSGIKTIPVDTYAINRQASSSSPLPPAPPPPQLPRRRRPPSEMKHKARRMFQSVAKQDKTEIKEMEFEKDESLSPTQPQPPPPSDVLKCRTEKKPSKIERKSSGAKEIASTLASLYNQRKRKKKHRNKENFDDIFPSAPYSHFGPPPPPPPPPPPASKFHELFKIGSKSKRIHSVLVSSPPPLPPMSPLRPTKHKTHRPQPHPATPPREISRPKKPTTPGKPPLPSKHNSFYYENLNSGNQSPLVPMPPPPPPPPFKMPGFKFIVRGDYAKLQSNHSSRSTSPDFDSVDTPTTPTTNNHGREGEAGVSAFCPSPDVNTKADTFIARFRAGLRMEKVKSKS